VLVFPDFKLPFILTTNASKRAIGANVSQVQIEMERPMAYASTQLNNAERAYTVSEQEMYSLGLPNNSDITFLAGSS
jgi:hypothetical protein